MNFIKNVENKKYVSFNLQEIQFKSIEIYKLLRSGD